MYSIYGQNAGYTVKPNVHEIMSPRDPLVTTLIKPASRPKLCSTWRFYIPNI